MSILRYFANWLRTHSAAHRAILRKRSIGAIGKLRDAHAKVVADAAAVERRLESELRYKAALKQIDAKLLTLTNRLQVAKVASDMQAAGALATATAQWGIRKQVCERELNLVRRRINASRHNWAILEKEALRIGVYLTASLVGARPIWAKAAHRLGERLVASIREERKQIASFMTRSALLYDGRDLSASLAQLRRIGNHAG